MAPFRRILVGVDLDAAAETPTPGSRNAADQARSLARRIGAEILFLHSLFREDAPAEELAVAHPARGAEAALEALREAAFRDDVPARVRFTRDRFWLDAVRTVLRDEADLVVTGKRNHPATDGRPLGSNAGKLVRKCPCAVWVVHPEHPRPRGRVLAADDLTPVGQRAARLAAWLVELYGGELHVVHAFQVPMSLQLELGRLSSQRAAERMHTLEAGLRAKLEGRVAERTPPGGVHVHLGRMAPADAIGEAVEKLDPDLLVLGTISKTAIAGLLVGHTAERLLGRVDCSLLTVKPEGFRTPVPRE